MSRIGKKPIQIPSGVTLTNDEGVIKVAGPKGTLTRTIESDISVEIDGNTVKVSPNNDDKRGRSLHGLTRTLIANMVLGVSEGFEKGLEIKGVGYRAEVEGSTLRMYLGYSNPVEYSLVDGISVKVEKQVNLVVSGIDKEVVGKVAAEIRGFRKPEPYKGKGIRYVGENVRRKVGKSAGA